MNQPDYLFLLGGADLEMCTIAQLLSDNGLTVGKNMSGDKLKWGAKLSEYKNLFTDTHFFVGIELTQDIDPPTHYINIDHHNENSNKNSSLEQVIDLLKSDFGISIEFTRELQLIATNDKGYIPAMIELGATPEEIAVIRRQDREAQGVTEVDEKLAEQSIRENLRIEKGITIVKSLTSKFSTITDQLYPCAKLLIHTDEELTYYGEDISRLTLAFDDLIKLHKAYSGGGENGFFGIAFRSLPPNELMDLKNQIISIQSNQT